MQGEAGSKSWEGCETTNDVAARCRCESLAAHRAPDYVSGLVGRRIWARSLCDCWWWPQGGAGSLWMDRTEKESARERAFPSGCQQRQTLTYTSSHGTHAAPSEAKKLRPLRPRYLLLVPGARLLGLRLAGLLLLQSAHVSCARGRSIERDRWIWLEEEREVWEDRGGIGEWSEREGPEGESERGNWKDGSGTSLLFQGFDLRALCSRIFFSNSKTRPTRLDTSWCVLAVVSAGLLTAA